MRLGTTQVTGWRRLRISLSPKEGALRYVLCAHNEDYDNYYHFSLLRHKHLYDSL